MKTSAIFANNETQNNTKSTPKPSANRSTQASFNHLYTKEISKKNTTNQLQKSEKNGIEQPGNTVKKTSNDSNDAIQNTDQLANDEDAKFAASPAPENNLGIISLLENANQFASRSDTTPPSKEKQQNTDLSVTDMNSTQNLNLQNIEIDSSELAIGKPNTAEDTFTQSGELDSTRQNNQGDISTTAAKNELNKDTATENRSETELKKQQAAPKSISELKEPLASSLQEKKLSHFDSQFNPAAENQLSPLKASETLSAAQEPVVSTLSNMAQAVSINNPPDAIAASKTALAPHVGSNGWDRALGQKVAWMISGGLQSAELSLNPPDLGPLQVVIKVSNDQTSANFFSAQPEVREALESALPRLRQMLNDAGMQLSGFSVGAQASSQGNAFSEGRPHAQANGNTTRDSSPVAASTNSLGSTKVQIKQGLVDTFA